MKKDFTISRCSIHVLIFIDHSFACSPTVSQGPLLAFVQRWLADPIYGSTPRRPTWFTSNILLLNSTVSNIAPLSIPLQRPLTLMKILGVSQIWEGGTRTGWMEIVADQKVAYRECQFPLEGAVRFEISHRRRNCTCERNWMIFDEGPLPFNCVLLLTLKLLKSSGG